MVRCVAVRRDGFDDEQSAAGRNRLAAFAQNPDRSVVVPVVQDMREQIGVVARRHGLEKNSGLKRATRAQPRRREVSAGASRLGRREEAASEARQLLAIDPGFSVRRFSVTVDIEPAVFAPIAEAWQQAGLPAG